MDMHYPPMEAPATPEYVLEVLQRVSCADAESELPLTLDTTAEQWLERFDMSGWSELAKWLNESWELKIPNREWKKVLQPAGERRIGDICAFIARHGRRPVIRSARFLGSECISAGAFLTIRSMLHDAGVRVEGIGPSTPLEPHTNKYHQAFLNRLLRLAPGGLPPVRINLPDFCHGTLAIYIAMLLLTIGELMDRPLMHLGGALLLTFAYLYRGIAYCCLPAPSVHFDGVYTFRDLAKALAEAQPSPASD